MVELTLQVSNSFAKKIQSFGIWSDIILELNLENFKNDSVKRAKSDLLKFLTKNPTAYEVLEFSLSEKFQNRVDNLLDLNGEITLKSADQKELQEWTRLNHWLILLAAKATKITKGKS